MVLKIGAEFRSVATPSQELLIKLSALAENGSILTGAGSSKNKNDHNTDDPFGDAFVLFFQQAAFERQMAELSSRLDRMDQASSFALHEAGENLRELRENANQNIFGRRVYQSTQDGQVYYEGGKLADQSDISMNDWKEGAGSFEDIQAAKQNIKDIQSHREKIQGAREQLDKATSSEELAKLEDEFSALEDEMPPAVASHYVPNQSEPTASLQKGSLLSSLNLRLCLKGSKQVVS